MSADVDFSAAVDDAENRGELSATAADAYLSGPGLNGVLLDGRRVDVQLERAIQTAEELESMDGASTFTLGILDPDEAIETSGVFDNAVDVELDGHRVYRLVKVSSAYPVLTLTFEDRDVVRLKGKRGYKKASRGKVTRAQFVQMLVREVKADRIAFFAPELTVRQRMADPDRKRKRKRVSGHRFPSGADIEVKGKRARRAQLKVLDDVLEEGVERGESRRLMIGAVMAVTQESTAQNLKGGDQDSRGAFQQQRTINGRRTKWPASRSVRKDAGGFYEAASPVFKAQPGRDIGWLVSEVQRDYTWNTARQGSDYERWRKEAEHTVDEWLGEAGGGVQSGGTYRKRFEFKRGEPGKPENSWVAIKRLAEEVKWRAFMRRGVLWYASETWMHRRRAVHVLHRRSPGVQSITYEADSGKKAQTATVVIYEAYLGALPGDVIALRNLARAAVGRYLVASVRRNRYSPLVTVSLKRPTKPLPEPASEVQERDADKGEDADGKSTGNMRWPTATRNVGSRFGPRRAPTAGASTNHDGIDIPIAEGTRVMAADGGKVVRAGPNGGYGNYVEIQHARGVVTFYAHLSRINVSVGSRVSKGDVIARSGNTGTSTGAHLHFGVHVRGKPVDPLRYL